MRTIHSLIKKSVAIVIFAAVTSANAITISLNPDEQTIKLGQEAVIQINMDFTDEPTIGGGIDIIFDNFTNGTELTFVSYEASNIGDPFLRRDPDVESNKLNSIGITDFNGLPEQALVGTITFLANEVGEFSLTPAESDGIAGGFFAFVDTGVLEQNPDFVGATITVEPAVIPLPAAFWLMASALGATLSLGREKVNSVS